MIQYLPFKTKKNNAFRLYLTIEGIFDDNTSDKGTMWYPGVFSSATWKISKDGGAVNNLSNAPVVVYGSIGYIDLTADEMNADVISVYGSYATSNSAPNDSYGYIGGVIIYTDNGQDAMGQTVYSPAVIAVVTQLTTKGYIVRDIAINESGYNYYGITSVSNDWYVIAREATDFSTIKYYMGYKNSKSYATQWAKRASLHYKDTLPLDRL